MLHRPRQQRVAERTGLVNQIRDFLSEHGNTLAQGVNQVRRHLPLILEDAENTL
ncbi:MAG: hypothetical protein RL563_49 [Pseudomonadota bacterium]|jgi:transposase